MVTLSSFVIVQQHFTRRRALAAGIASAGISIGSLSSGPIMQLLTKHYGWRGTLLIMSAITLNSCAFGILYRPARACRAATTLVTTVVTDEKNSSLIENGGSELIGNNGKEKVVQGGSSSSPQAAVTVASTTTVLEMFLVLFKATFNISIFSNWAFTLVCFGTFFMNIGTTIFYQHTPSRAKSVGIDRSQVYIASFIQGASKKNLVKFLSKLNIVSWVF